MTCTGSGFEGSCQVPGAFTAHGVYVPPDLNLTGVVVKGPGTTKGFDNGVSIVGSDALVKGITITGPACDPERLRPAAQQRDRRGRHLDRRPDPGQRRSR